MSARTYDLRQDVEAPQAKVRDEQQTIEALQTRLTAGEVAHPRQVQRARIDAGWMSPTRPRRRIASSRS
jgi:hypothetical protein